MEAGFLSTSKRTVNLGSSSLALLLGIGYHTVVFIRIESDVGASREEISVEPLMVRDKAFDTEECFGIGLAC